MSFFAGLENWPVDNVSAGLVGVHDETFGDIDRVYELASVTKLLSAYGFLVALEEGVFELDTPMGPATVEHLLAHASGVGFATRESERAPEDRRIYSSSGFEILADGVEKLAGIAFPDYLREAVFEPLGMTATQFHAWAGHGAKSTVRDLQRFATELLSPQLIDATTLHDAFTPHFPTLAGIVPGYGRQVPCPWGLGFEIKGEKSPHWTGPSMPAEVVGHFGQAGTFLWVHPESGHGCVVLTNRVFGDWAKPLWSDFNEQLWLTLN
ncbi:beta-lactamase family protein [Corynebacterium hindlerae]|uniref:Beta-lactamase family protein n=1 Tax=Corynebacterium hindlerae TaxID=699041 RepID=A0A7G5FE94_9CORY|nr:serine hydrolase domain-containing protein [Corynebacterium hindlerae]QMV84935.1 beta-lactamase family protein [Corynebacterium hindlerae]